MSCVPIIIHMNTYLSLLLLYPVSFCCVIVSEIFEQKFCQTEMLMVQDASTMQFLYNFPLYNLNLHVADFWQQQCTWDFFCWYLSTCMVIWIYRPVFSWYIFIWTFNIKNVKYMEVAWYTCTLLLCFFPFYFLWVLKFSVLNIAVHRKTVQEKQSNIV